MNKVTQVQILDEAVYISHKGNSLGKDMNSTIPSPAMGKIVGRTGLFNFGIVTDLSE